MIITVLSLLLFLAEPAASTISPEQDAPAKAPDPAAEQPDEYGPVVKVLSTGDEPRERAKLSLHVGDVQFAVMEVDMQMKMAMDGVVHPSPPMPVISVNMRITVEEAFPDGRWKYAAEFTSVDITPKDETPAEVVTMMRGMISEMAGMKMSAEIDSEGRQRNLEIVSKIANPMLFQLLESMKQSVSQMAIRLPEEEIGMGARWEVDAKINVGGIAVRQRSTYRLVSREGNTVKLGISTQQSPAEKNAAIKNLPEGVSGTLVDIAGNGKGELVYDLLRVLPARGHITGESVANMDMEGPGMKAKVDTHMTMSMVIRESKGPAQTAESK
ncbi:MAG: hypothetical protein KF691_15685 [Phycisphaeraceae bacterium]|nr:hypothetical protein [Phycisphaeraceae bacterium]